MKYNSFLWCIFLTAKNLVLFVPEIVAMPSLSCSRSSARFEWTKMFLTKIVLFHLKMCHRTGQSRTLSNVRMNMVYVMAANPCDVKLCRHAHPSTCRWHFPKWVSRLQNALHSFFYNWLSLSQKNPTRMTRMSWIPAIICSDSCSGIGCGNKKKWDILNVFSCSLHISNPFFYQQWYHQTCTSFVAPSWSSTGSLLPI